MRYRHDGKGMLYYRSWINKNENIKSIEAILRDLYWSDRLRTKKEIQLKLRKKKKRAKEHKKKTMNHKSASWNRNVVSWSTDRWQWVSISCAAGAVAQNDMLHRMISHNRHFGGSLIHFSFIFLLDLYLSFFICLNSSFVSSIGQNHVATIKCGSCVFWNVRKRITTCLESGVYTAFHIQSVLPRVTLDLKEIGSYFTNTRTF
jgi:hypothetical protein